MRDISLTCWASGTLWVVVVAVAVVLNSGCLLSATHFEPVKVADRFGGKGGSTGQQTVGLEGIDNRIDIGVIDSIGFTFDVDGEEGPYDLYFMGLDGKQHLILSANARGGRKYHVGYDESIGYLRSGVDSLLCAIPCADSLTFYYESSGNVDIELTEVWMVLMVSASVE